MATSLSTLSASVTRILSLTGFPKELKTKDIHTAFSEWESANGGFKIKWIDDTSLYIVFHDPSIAKRAYLRTLAYPPAIFSSATQETQTVIRPYDGPDAQTVIQAINARQTTGNSSRRSASISVPGPRGGPAGSGTAPFRAGHAAHASMSVHPTGGAGIGASGAPFDAGAPLTGLATSFSTGAMGSIGRDREPSPTLPNIPSQPTLDALIGATLHGANANGDAGKGVQDPAIMAAAPRIGDPGKRMLGHALGVRHPGLGGRANGTGADTMRAMGGLTIAE